MQDEQANLGALHVKRAAVLAKRAADLEADHAKQQVRKDTEIA